MSKKKETPSPDGLAVPIYTPTQEQITPGDLATPITEAVKQMPSPDGTPIPDYGKEAKSLRIPSSEDVYPTKYTVVTPPQPPRPPRKPKRSKPSKWKDIISYSRKGRRTHSDISSSMICWNEAQTIDLAIKSIADLVDEVIIVDTGSFDGTPWIAREWIDELDLSGQVKQIRCHNLAQAHLKSYELCSSGWVIVQDSNLVLSDPLKSEIKTHIKKNPEYQLSVKSLNLFGDYEHYFTPMPYHAPHKIIVKNDTAWIQNTERQYFDMPEMKASNWAVNLSRVRPAWRSWYRGEPFDPELYSPVGSKPGAVGHMHKLNRQFQWHKQQKYGSLVDYVKATMGLSLEEVKEIAPEWYLNYLQKYAKVITKPMRQGLPEAIIEELKYPRYKLIHNIGKNGKKGKITDRWPEL